MAKFNVRNAQFLTGAAAGVPSTEIAQVRDGDVTLGELSMVETTTITDATKTMTSGVRETMGGTITIVWDPAAATHSTLMTTYLAKTAISIGFKLRDTATSPPATIKHWYGDGFITNLSAPIASSGGNAVMECTVTFKLKDKLTVV
jgi:hypothetical protein